MIEKDFDEIENSDFEQRVKIEPYVASRDRYSIPNISLNKAEQESTELMLPSSLESAGEHDQMAELMNECRFGDMKKFKGRVQKIKKSQAKNPAYWNVIAACYIYKKEWAKAKLFLDRAFSLVKNYSPALNNFGVMQASIGEDRFALELFQEAAKENGVVPKINMGITYLKFFHAQKALQAVSTIQGDTHWKVTAIKASSQYMLGNYGESIKYFSSIIEKDQFEKTNFNVNYALALFYNGNKSDARDQFLKGSNHYTLSPELVSSIHAQLGI